MSNTTKNSLITLIITVVIFALLILGYQHYRTEPISTDNVVSGNLVPDLNKELNSVIEDISQNTENTVTNTDVKEDETVENSNQLTPKEQQAINLAKKEWIKDNEDIEGLEFNASIQGDGKYLITVYDLKTTRLIKGYVVDVDTEIITEK